MPQSLTSLLTEQDDEDQITNQYNKRIGSVIDFNTF